MDLVLNVLELLPKNSANCKAYMESLKHLLDPTQLSCNLINLIIDLNNLFSSHTCSLLSLSLFHSFCNKVETKERKRSMKSEREKLREKMRKFSVIDVMNEPVHNLCLYTPLNINAQNRA